MTFGSRREARERALELLYEADAKGLAAADLLAELPVPPDPFTLDLLRGLGRDLERVDATISRHLRPDWPINRIAVVDLAVLRLATYELAERDDVPTAVVLSEAVELAKRYSTDDSGRFVNGVLAAVADELRPGRPERPERPERPGRAGGGAEEPAGEPAGPSPAGGEGS